MVLQHKVFLNDDNKTNEENNELYLTTDQVATLWTNRAIEMGYLHYYEADSVRQALKQHRIQANEKCVGTNRLFALSEVKDTDIRPWMRIKLQGEEKAKRPYPCEKCKTPVSSEELNWRSWYWCRACQNEFPHMWINHKRNMNIDEDRVKKGIYRETLERGELRYFQCYPLK